MEIGNVNAIIIKACMALRKNKNFNVEFIGSKEKDADYSTLHEKIFYVTFKYPNGKLYTLQFRESFFTNPYSTYYATSMSRRYNFDKINLEDKVILFIAWYIYKEGIEESGMVHRMPKGYPGQK